MPKAFKPEAFQEGGMNLMLNLNVTLSSVLRATAQITTIVARLDSVEIMVIYTSSRDIR